MASPRPKPEAFLPEARQEARTSAGRLKVFLGASPGVGKTYSMLQAARVRKGEGEEVVIGVVETHGRPDTQALLESLEVLPRKGLEHRGIKLQEFDIDSALARSPALLLVDELAHTNAPGSRNAKRWQDVLELLDKGVNVYSALNVQHLESLNDVVAKITGVRIRETVPDSLLERADVELVDLPPEELLERLREGKVYLVPEMATRAAENFFRLSNLTALRELALRITAEGVNAVLESYRARQAPETIWATTQRILVCVGPGAESAKLIRAARRIAVSAQAEWVAVSVDSARRPLSTAERSGAVENLRLAEQLGADPVTLSADDPVEAILALARQRNITRIVVGKSERPRWLELIRGSVVDELIRKSGDIEIDVLKGESNGGPLVPVLGRPAGPVPWSEYGVALGAAAVCTAVCFALFPFLQLTNLVMVYLLGTLIVASRGHRGPATLFAFLSVLLFDFCFVPPRFHFSVSDTQYIFTFLVMFLTAFLISQLTLRLRSQAEAARSSEMRASAMHALSRQLASTRGLRAILEVSVRHLAQIFDSDVVALLPKPEGELESKFCSGASRDLDEKERSVAQWVFDLGQPAGLGTQTLSVVKALYAPLIGAESPVGVLRVEPKNAEHVFAPEQMLLLESFAHQIALALEVDRLQENVRDTRIRAETERLRSSLLSSVSHDFRTPLAAIIGSASSLLQSGTSLATGKAHELLENIKDEAQRLARLVHNLLETTRLESSSVKLKKEPYSIEEVAGAALGRLEKDLAGRKVTTDFPESLPLVPLDAVLVEQVFMNLIENAAHHTPPGTGVEISAKADAAWMTVEVADRGPGIPPEDLEKIFEKFYRVPASSVTGAGLGLAICKAVVAAHGGRIWAQNRAGGGAAVQFTLPLEGRS